ncbi:MAG: DNA repair protein RecN [Acidimicrobiales bacterium]
MLSELRVRNLGVIEDLSLLLGPGLTALTGETGAGKTLVVEALKLLLGGRADPIMVRPGAAEALVEGRFLVPTAPAGAEPAQTGPEPAPAGAEPAPAGEVVLARSVSASGRSRAYVDGRMATVASLAQAGAGLVDLHDQHSHHSLMSSGAQRHALDRAGGIDTSVVEAARRRLAEIASVLAGAGGGSRERARQVDLLAYQLGELDGAALDDPDEDAALELEEALLAGASAHREAAGRAAHLLGGDGPAAEALGAALSGLAGRPPLAAVADRLMAVMVELGDVAAAARSLADQIEEDPERLAWVVGRRQALRSLRRKYGDSLADVVSERERIRAQLGDLRGQEGRAAALETDRGAALEALARAEAAVGTARRAAAPAFATAVEGRLRTLALPAARFEVALGDEPAADSVTWRLGANPGEPALPLAKVASGGELSRTMLAARLALLDHRAAPATSPGPRPGVETLVFDEVDAGIGGEAALAVGAALAALARDHQILVVTHLPQVAAYADRQVVLGKEPAGGRTLARARHVEGDQRVIELSRMLSGQPSSETARRHAAELLGMAAGDTDQP